ncbi:MAG: hypothetical protein HY909_20060 [Deltaproteobacteria bacterium]|nr:hypothetical protein [Deltaproteobacteria bacterium]
MPRSALFALLLTGQCSRGSPEGAACTSAIQCASGLCLARSATVRVCVRRCAADSECTAGDVCGRYDFRGRDPDSGLLVGDKNEIVRVCRPSLRRPCDVGCGMDRCDNVGSEPTSSSCRRTCRSRAECGGRQCVGVCGEGLCASPCDSVLECPSGWGCDLVNTDLDGHGQCILLGPAVDGAVPDDCGAPSAD